MGFCTSGWAAGLGGDAGEPFLVRDKVTRLQCPQISAFEEKEEPKRIRTEVPAVKLLAAYCQSRHCDPAAAYELK